MAKRLTQCPVCETALNVTEMTCSHCQTRIQGQFGTCRFCRLSPEHLGFLETFLRCEGNLSRVEKELSLSYPTVRNRFTAMIAALNFEEPDAPPSNPNELRERKQQVLESVARGTMSAEEAAEALREL